jgi:hypothetical protein
MSNWGKGVINNIGWGQGANNDIGWGNVYDKSNAGQTLLSGSGSDFDSDYQAVLDFATSEGYTLPSENQQILQNQLVLDLKSNGIWSDLDAFGVLATDGDSDFALIDWVRLITMTANSSPAFATNAGFTGNGTSSYIDTLFSVSDGTNYQLSDSSLGVYYNNVLTRTNDGIGMGFRDGANNNSNGIGPWDSIQLLSGINNAKGFYLLYYTRENGYFMASRKNNTNYDVYVDGDFIENLSKSETSSVSTNNFYLLAFNDTGNASLFSDDQILAFHFGSSLDGKEVILNTLITNYKNAI